VRPRLRALADEGELLEELLSVAWELGLDAALDVSDEEQIEALERVIFVLSSENGSRTSSRPR
jgi:hypothetical protein